MISDSISILGSSAAMLELLVKRVEVTTEEKKTYADKLEGSTGDEIFKYILLINISALEGYVAQTRLQAQQSFQLSKIIAIVGFAILSVAITLSIYLTMSGNTNLNAAYLGTIAGVITEFTAGVFFYLYNKTLQQINLFHDRLISMQQISMSYMTTSVVQDEERKDQARIDLSRQLLEAAKTGAANKSLQTDRASPGR